jgi:hypothetical protein
MMGGDSTARAMRSLVPFERTGPLWKAPHRLFATVAIAAFAPWRLVRFDFPERGLVRRLSFALLFGPLLVAAFVGALLVASAALEAHPDLPAPQAGLMAATAQGIVSARPDVDWPRVVRAILLWTVAGCTASALGFFALGLMLSVCSGTARRGIYSPEWSCAAYLAPLQTIAVGAMAAISASVVFGLEGRAHVPAVLEIPLFAAALWVSFAAARVFRSAGRRCTAPTALRTALATIIGAVAIWPVAWLQLQVALLRFLLGDELVLLSISLRRLWQ